MRLPSLSVARCPEITCVRIVTLRLVCLGLALVVSYAHALSGADVAYLINQRFQSTVAQCARDKAAWHCSGVLMRPLPGDSAWTFAQLTKEEATLQVANVAYVRRDVGTTALASSAGMILADGVTATGLGKAYEVRCAYPFVAALSEGLSSHGCDRVGNSQPVPPDWSSCGASGVADTSGWLAHFNAQGGDVTKQCSLSALVARQFKASLEAHEQASVDLRATPNMLLMAAWDPAKPETLPIQAFYYDVANGGQLTQAQRYQRQYFDATGSWLPILRVSMDGTAATAFGFDERDQLDEGFRVVEQLQARFDDLSACGNLPAYLCNGVLYRITGYGNFHSWNPSPSAISLDGVSMAYTRKDSRATEIPWLSGAGLIFNTLGAPTQTPLIARCAYPADGYSDHRTNRCGMTTSPLSATCVSQGVTTLAQWQAHYARATWMNQCSFAVDKAAFDLVIAAHASFPVPPRPLEHGWTELVVKPWPQDIPTQIPLQAVFYTPGELAGAQYIQRDYMAMTGRFLPLIKMDIKGTPDKPFSYAPSDQATAE